MHAISFKLGKATSYSGRLNLKGLFRRWKINYATRRKLLTMDEHQLKDIGISQLMATQEGNKPFWR